MGKPSRKIIKEFDLEEISGVDRPAQPTAKFTIMKSDTAISKVLDFAQEAAKIKLDGLLWPLSDAFSRVVSGIVSFEGFDAAEKAIKIKEAATLFGDSLAKEISKTNNPLSSLVSNTGLIDVTKNEGKDMSEELNKALDDVKADLEKVKLELVKAEQFGELTDKEKELLKEMSDEEKAKFLSSTKEERELAKSFDETLTIGGQSISKRVVGVETFSVLKAQQDIIKAQTDAVAKAKDEAKTSDLKKRASEEFSSLPGSDEEIAQVLKSIEGLDAGVQKSLQNIMLAGSKSVQGALVTKGVSTGDIEAGSADEQLDTLAKAHAKENSTTYAQAYASVIEKRSDLYIESLK